VKKRQGKKPVPKPFDLATAPTEDVETKVFVQGNECVIAYSRMVNLVRLDREGLGRFIDGLRSQHAAMPIEGTLAYLGLQPEVGKEYVALSGRGFRVEEDRTFEGDGLVAGRLEGWNEFSRKMEWTRWACPLKHFRENFKPAPPVLRGPFEATVEEARNHGCRVADLPGAMPVEKVTREELAARYPDPKEPTP